ncbi:MAG TPA: thioredoxin domain-containing protein, partial [Thermoplasmata archaeon]|nr:thioredoxin domain-containing protein [Thermoplasmata archaeon]
MGENRLAQERSSYLRSAARQPVHWLPWGEEAFRTAKAEDKPVLLDIGAVWCHWCHVIDRESYEDPEVAAIINERYVAVKVDRDERPDVDARYQQAVQTLSGQGGWPLTAVLTPEGKVFYGGTYFPPVEASGRPSFKRVLVAVSDHYKKDRAEATKEADSLHRALSQRLPMVAT